MSGDVLEDTAIRVGENGHKEAQCWFKQEYTKCNPNPTQDPLQRDIREWTNPAEKGKGHNQPKGKGKGKGKSQGKIPCKENHNQEHAGSPDEETGQRKLNDFGMKRKRTQFDGDVHEHDDGLETPREDRAAYVFCVHSCKNAMGECLDLPSSSVISGVQASEEPAGTHERKLDRTTGEMLLAVGCRDDRRIVGTGSVVSTCPVDWATSVPTEKVNCSENLESVLGESLQHCGVKHNVLFANRKSSTMSVNVEVTDTKRAILSGHKGCGNGSMIVFTADGRGNITNDKGCIEHVQQVMETTPGFDIV